MLRQEVEVTLAKLPRALDGFSIAQLSDIHVGPTIGRAFIEDVVRTTNAFTPDLVAITGDLVDGSVAELRDAVAPLANLASKHGTFFVTGNHEYYAGVDEWTAHLPSLGIKVLRNERVAVGGEAGFDLAGIDDYTSAGFPGHGPDLPRALAGRDAARELVLLAHQPKAVARGQAARRRPPALGAHPRRADLALGLRGAPAAAVRGGAGATPRPDPALRRAAAPATGDLPCG